MKIRRKWISCVRNNNITCWYYTFERFPMFAAGKLKKRDFIGGLLVPLSLKKEKNQFS